MGFHYILKDNQRLNNAYTFVDDEVYSSQKGMDPTILRSSDWDEISKMSNIDDLPNIIMIPQLNLRDNNKEILTRTNNKLSTNNWVGVISKNNDRGEKCRIEIHSRFDTEDNQFFLLYLFCNVFGINAFEHIIDSKQEGDFNIVLILLFLRYLQDAFDDGLYKEYTRKKYNDYSFKGSFEVGRHIKQNNPFVGKSAYSVREYSYDNDVLHLMRQTIDYIGDQHKQLLEEYDGSAVISEIDEVIASATPSYQFNVNYAESINCRKSISHPLFEKYEEARKLALLVLEEAGQNPFNNSDEETFGILIDVAWLWEEYIALKLLNDNKYKHILTDGTEGSLNWAKNRKWYPDFIEDLSEDERRNILDAKYKFWNYEREDVHQILSYMFLTGGTLCGVIYPDNDEIPRLFEGKELLPFKSFYDDKTKVMFYKMPLYIPKNKHYTYSDYVNRIGQSEAMWKYSFARL